jgi:hypothetical protein
MFSIKNPFRIRIDLAPAMIEMDFGRMWPGVARQLVVYHHSPGSTAAGAFEPHGVDYGGDTASAPRARNLTAVQFSNFFLECPDIHTESHTRHAESRLLRIWTTCRHVWSFLSNVEGNNFGE